MRSLPIVLAAALLGSAALAQQREPAAEVHCVRDERRSEEPAQAERRCLERLTALASRDGDVLRLALDDGSFKTFMDERTACEQHEAEKCLMHRLATYYPIQRLFVVERQAYESFDVIVVSGRTGGVTRMDAHPHLSPGGTRLVAAAAIEAWEVEQHIAIYYVQKDGLKAEWSYKAKVYELWEFVSWNGDERIELNVTLRTVNRGGAEELATQRAGLRRTIVGWELNKNVAR
ncbi:MAG TPA: hypothetical protein VKD43_02950 [Xanthobacteraceae bacterium]|nr:hypothetical protein [Xanthobacteraceae bacterium]